MSEALDDTEIAQLQRRFECNMEYEKPSHLSYQGYKAYMARPSRPSRVR